VVQKVTVPPKLNGNPSLWNAPGKATGIYAGSRQVASLKLCYDDTNLYALFEVGHPTGRFKNGASTPEMMMFGGDALCLYFQKPNQIQTAQRIVFGTVKGGRASVVMRPLSDAQRPFSYASPVSTTKFEYVAPAPEILLVLLSEQRRYIAEARIPWKVLGITPAAGSKLGFDAQVIYGDSSGTSPSSMYWWHTRGVDANTVMDAAAMAKLDPTDWGELILK
jgi:hypothetical protein